jgi:type IV pilus assembly protein PilQ
MTSAIAHVPCLHRAPAALYRGIFAFACVCLAAIGSAGAQSLPPLLAANAPGVDLGELLKPVPLSISSPPLPAVGGNAELPRSPLAMPPDAQPGAMPNVQILGSTTNGTITKAYTITHLRASDVQTLLADPAAPLIARETSSVVVDARSNTLIVRGTEAEHQVAENLVRRIDVPVKQILIEVKIVSADESFGQSLGARFGLTKSHMLNAATPHAGGIQAGATVADLNSIASNGTTSFPNMVSLPATSALKRDTAPSTFAFGLYKLPAGLNIGVEISALEEAGLTKVLSSPRLVLSNFRPGVLSSGQRIPYSKPSLVQGVNTTEFIDAKVSISVTALVAPDGSISMDLSLTDDSVGSTSAVGPTINTNQLTSNVTLKNGETLVLGGFQSSTEAEDSSKTPFFGDLPVVGHLFKRRANSSVKRELLFILTPMVVGTES